MKITINNQQTKQKDLVYEENFWTGKKSVKYNGVNLTKIKRNKFEYKNGEAVETFVTKGNSVFGASIFMFNNKVELVRKFNWYEILLTILIFVSCLAVCIVACCGNMLGVGNSMLLGSTCGAIGGALAITNLFISRKINTIWKKVVVSIELLILTVVLCVFFSHIAFRAFVLNF